MTDMTTRLDLADASIVAAEVEKVWAAQPEAEFCTHLPSKTSLAV